MKGDAGPQPVNDDPAQAGKYYSFRMAYWRPVWRYKIGGGPRMEQLELLFRGAVLRQWQGRQDDHRFMEVSADIVVRKGVMDGKNPLGFEAAALSDLLINQVSPPE